MTREKALSLDASDVTESNMLTVALALGREWTTKDAALYGVRRILALAKDGARKASGKAAAHVYTPDLSRVEDKATLKTFAAKVAGIAHTYVEPLEAVPAKEKPAPKSKAPAAKKPTLRKAAKVKPAEGGAVAASPL